MFGILKGFFRAEYAGSFRKSIHLSDPSSHSISCGER